MKNVLILHSTANDSNGNWYSWLRDELTAKGYVVWLPDLPNSETPNIQIYNKFILENKDWVFNEDSIIIGHSSGAVAALGLLEVLPMDVKINKCILVSVFENDLGWPVLQGLFIKPLEYELIKQKSKKFILIHSENDPHCPLEGAEHIASKIDGQLIIKKGQGNFNLQTGEYYKKFPFLLELVD